MLLESLYFYFIPTLTLICSLFLRNLSFPTCPHPSFLKIEKQVFNMKPMSSHLPFPSFLKIEKQVFNMKPMSSHLPFPSFLKIEKQVFNMKPMSLYLPFPSFLKMSSFQLLLRKFPGISSLKIILDSQKKYYRRLNYKQGVVF